MSKALRASKTQRRDGQIIPNLSDLTEKPDFLTRFAVTKSKHTVCGQIIPHLSDLTEKPDFLTRFAVMKSKHTVC